VLRMKARDVMSHGTECIGASETIEQAARRLSKLDVGSMPICGDDDRLKGMLTDRDIVVKVIAKGRDVAQTLAGELAEGKPVTIGADDTIGEILKTMERARVRRLPVIDGHRLVGIISQADIARHLRPRQAGKMLAEISKPKRRSRAMTLLPVIAAAGAASYVAMRRTRSRGLGTISADTVVNVPVHAAYDQWTKFERFPSFMAGVEEVRQLDDTHLHWRAKVAGKEREWDAQITSQQPDQQVSWRSTTGTRNDGTVRFEPLDPHKTRVKVEMAFQPEGVSEQMGAAIGLPNRRVKADLERFRKLIEEGNGATATTR
jgi:CBS domain-containing protein